jgi:Spy/CpxP family protein refolding chaperone
VYDKAAFDQALAGYQSAMLDKNIYGTSEIGKVLRVMIEKAPQYERTEMMESFESAKQKALGAIKAAELQMARKAEFDSALGGYLKAALAGNFEEARETEKGLEQMIDKAPEPDRTVMKEMFESGLAVAGPHLRKAEFNRALEEYSDAIFFGNVGSGSAEKALQQVISKTPETERAEMEKTAESVKATLPEQAKIAAPTLGKIGELQMFVPKLMACTNLSEMRKLIADASELYRAISLDIQQLPEGCHKRVNDFRANALLPEKVSNTTGLANVANVDRLLRATGPTSLGETDPSLIILVVKYKTVSDMIRVGLRPMGAGKEDAQFAEQLLRDAGKKVQAVTDDPSIATMRELVDGWRLVGPDTTEGMSPVELGKLTASQNMAIRDFYGTSVKIDRYLSLIKKTVPLLQEGKILSERSLEALDGLMRAHAAMLEMRNTFEGCLTPEAREQLSELNVSMVAAQDGAERSRLQGLATKAFLEGIDQDKALEYLSSPEMLSALSGVAKFMSSAPDIMQEVTKGLGALSTGAASRFGGKLAPDIIKEAKSQNMTAVNILQLTNSLIASLNADVVGGFNNGTQELLRNLPEDHARKDGIMNNFAQLKRLLSGS